MLWIQGNPCPNLWAQNNRVHTPGFLTASQSGAGVDAGEWPGLVSFSFHASIFSCSKPAGLLTEPAHVGKSCRSNKVSASSWHTSMLAWFENKNWTVHPPQSTYPSVQIVSSKADVIIIIFENCLVWVQTSRGKKSVLQNWVSVCCQFQQWTTYGQSCFISSPSSPASAHWDIFKPSCRVIYNTLSEPPKKEELDFNMIHTWVKERKILEYRVWFFLPQLLKLPQFPFY